MGHSVEQSMMDSGVDWTGQVGFLSSCDSVGFGLIGYSAVLVRRSTPTVHSCAKRSGLGLGRACSSIRATHNSETAVIASACGRSDAQLISYALLHPSKRRAQLAQYDSHSRVHSLHLNQLGVQLQPIGPIAGRNRRKTRRMGLATRAVQSKLWRNDKEHSTLRCEAAPAIQQWPGRSKQLHASACARKSGTL